MKRLRGCLLVVVVLLGVSVAALGFGYWDQYTYDAKVPLGTWYGSFTSPAGVRGAILVVVVRKQLKGIDARYNGKSNSVTFDGSARLCLAAEAEQRLRLSGYTDVTGAGFTFSFGRVSGPPSGLEFVDGLHGERRPTTLSMSGQLRPFAPPGVPPPATIDLRPTAVVLSAGDAPQYTAACAAATAVSR